jgi:hypothetical protein
MTLWEIDKRISDILETGMHIDEETGEVFLPEDLDLLNIERDEKIEGIALYVKNLKAEAEAIHTEIDRMKDRAESKKKKAERLSQYLSSVLCGQKFETAKTSLSFRKSSVVQINNELLVPEEFMKVKTEKKPDKTAIANRIKCGEFVPGCELVEKNNLQIK